jgi:Holliday junction DNA helicase RuvA
MIAHLTGRVTQRDSRTITLDVHGVGFRVFMPARGLERLVMGNEATINTYLHVREDALELYGFASIDELRLFEKLLTVSGVGPKVALAVLSAASVSELEQAIERGQSALLTAVSGVGTKTAERIIVDLRGKLEHDDAADSSLSGVIEALTQLGYSLREAREAAAATGSDDPIEQRIKAALKRLGR